MARRAEGKEISFGVNIEVNAQGSVSAAYFSIRPGKSAHVREFADGNAFADYDHDGRLLGIELLGPCQIAVLDRIARKEPAQVKKFVRQSMPRGLALATA